MLLAHASPLTLPRPSGLRSPSPPLQDRVPPMTRAAAHDVLASELAPAGLTPEEVFEWVDWDPLGSASLAQVRPCPPPPLPLSFFLPCPLDSFMAGARWAPPHTHRYGHVPLAGPPPGFFTMPAWLLHGRGPPGFASLAQVRTVLCPRAPRPFDG